MGIYLVYLKEVRLERFIVLMLFVSLGLISPAFSQDWYSYYLQCVATSSQESSCYESIREYLSTPEGKKQAKEIGFRRRLFRDQEQVTSQSIVISNRIQQMENFLNLTIQKGEASSNAPRSYCLREKKNQMDIIKNNVEKLKASILAQNNATHDGQIESDYQLMLSLNLRANEIYEQARQCLQ